MIFRGYPGIGKSTLASKDQLYIDLESSQYKEEYNSEWVKHYVNRACLLSDAGYIVFISTHNEVKLELEARKVKYANIFPSLKLEQKWKSKLFERYLTNVSEKNARAYERCANYFKQDIDKMYSDSNSQYVLNNIVIEDINYDLNSLIKNFLKEDEEEDDETTKYIYHYRHINKDNVDLELYFDKDADKYVTCMFKNNIENTQEYLKYLLNDFTNFYLNTSYCKLDVNINVVDPDFETDDQFVIFVCDSVPECYFNFKEFVEGSSYIIYPYTYNR